MFTPDRLPPLESCHPPASCQTESWPTKVVSLEVARCSCATEFSSRQTPLGSIALIMSDYQGRGMRGLARARCRLQPPSGEEGWSPYTPTPPLHPPGGTRTNSPPPIFCRSVSVLREIMAESKSGLAMKDQYQQYKLQSFIFRWPRLRAPADSWRPLPFP